MTSFQVAQPTLNRRNAAVAKRAERSPAALRIATDATERVVADIDEQIATLRAAPAGWLGGGESVAATGLTWLRNAMLTKIDLDDAAAPYFYPTENGNVSVEWTIGSVVADLEIDLVTRQALWGQSDIATRLWAERRLNLDEDADWQWLDRTLRDLVVNAGL